MDLTPRQKRFVSEYLIDLNGTKAAIRAGYAPASAAVEANRLLKKDRVQQAIAIARKSIAAISGITPERVVAELAKIGFSDIRKLVHWRSNVTEIGENPDTGEPELKSFNDVQLVDSAQLDDETAGAIAEISQTKDGALKVKMYDKRGALVDIGRHLGMFATGKPKVDGEADAVGPAGKKPEEDWDRLLN